MMLLLAVISGHAKNESPAELKARADGATGGEKAKLCLEYAHVRLESADALFTKGDVEPAQQQVQEVMQYIHKSADAAISSGKRLKQTEIDLRKLEKRMRDLAQSLNLEDRPAVSRAVDDIEQIRANLLARMFGEKAEPKEKS
jgi:hypothetical protein